MLDILEPDWRLYSKKIFPLARNRFYARVVAQIEKILADDSLSANEKYIAVSKHLEKVDDEIDRLFGRFRRSSAKVQFATMIQSGLVTDDEISEFSDDMKEFLARIAAFASE